MNPRRCILIGLSAVLMCFSAGRVAPAQGPSDPVIDALHQRVSQFLEGVSLGTPTATSAAYQELLAGSPLAKQTKAVDALIEKTSQLQERFGPYREFEQIAARRVGNDLVLLKYLYKCENFPVVWYFTFYRTPRADIPPETNDTWRVIIVRFDNELELLGL
jgi:hypothetical protein